MRRRQESRKIGGSGACSLSRANSLQILNMTVEPLMPSRAYSFVHLALFDSVTVSLARGKSTVEVHVDLCFI